MQKILRLKCKITVLPKIKRLGNGTVILPDKDKTVIEFVNDVEINTSFQDLTSTAKITLPRNIRTFDGRPLVKNTSSYFNRGDKVIIELGYAPNTRVVFIGYINRIYFQTPVVIECLDSMFVLMQKHIIYPLTKGSTDYGEDPFASDFKKIDPRINAKKDTLPTNVTQIKLKDLIKDVFLNIVGFEENYYDELVDIKNNFECLDTNVYIYKRFDSSVSECFEKIKSEYGLQTYFKLKLINGELRPVLHVGFESDATQGNKVEFKFEENIIDYRDLNFQQSQDVILKIRVENIDTKTNKRTFYQLGPDFGEQRDYKLMNATEDDIKKFAEKKQDENAYTGYHGNFLTFGENYAEPGDVANLTSKRYPEKNGQYQVKSVRRTFGTNGYRQTIELGARLVYSESSKIFSFEKVPVITDGSGINYYESDF